MRQAILAASFVALVTFEASAGSVLVYDGDGKLDHVIRPSPSGYIVYDSRGGIVSAVRQFGFGQWSVIDRGRSNVRVLGTGLLSDVSTLKGGVGFD